MSRQNSPVLKSGYKAKKKTQIPLWIGYNAKDKNMAGSTKVKKTPRLY